MSQYALNLAVQFQLLLEDAKANLRKIEQGQGMVEYSLILALISIAAMAVLFTIGTNVTARFTEIAACVGAPAAC